jgi:hypothetical protein
VKVLPAKQPGQQEFPFEGIAPRVAKPKQRRKVSAALAAATALKANGEKQGAAQSAASTNRIRKAPVQQELDLGS